jgi:hypothetical protein
MGGVAGVGASEQGRGRGRRGLTCDAVGTGMASITSARMRLRLLIRDASTLQDVQVLESNFTPGGSRANLDEKQQNSIY